MSFSWVNDQLRFLADGLVGLPDDPAHEADGLADWYADVVLAVEYEDGDVDVVDVPDWAAAEVLRLGGGPWCIACEMNL
uniref:Uncharacterized protein n=1 Tax=Mycena chlorophos TaxID=658473 RepID=A0ABQ0LEY1_MYCCL|nr:predicted protein [Mycena chlorophos]